MPASTITFHLDEGVLKDLVFLARHANKIGEIVGLAAEMSATASFEEIVKYVARKTKIPEPDVSRILQTLHYVIRTQAHSCVETPQFLDMVTHDLKERNGEPGADDEVKVWQEAINSLQEAIGKMGPDHRFSFSRNSDDTEAEWLVERAKYALLVIQDCVEVNPNKRGGVPVLRGTRFTVAQLFAEISEGRSLGDIAEDFDIDLVIIKKVMESFAIHFDRPFAK
ncbi:MAG TPA: DUF433 domain-containing protein [Gemmataceae bacterium]|nr:DUF433 domain-containing protein [Gemmataceae bacterium]